MQQEAGNLDATPEFRSPATHKIYKGKIRRMKSVQIEIYRISFSSYHFYLFRFTYRDASVRDKHPYKRNETRSDESRCIKFDILVILFIFLSGLTPAIEIETPRTFYI